MKRLVALANIAVICLSTTWDVEASVAREKRFVGVSGADASKDRYRKTPPGLKKSEYYTIDVPVAVRQALLSYNTKTLAKAYKKPLGSLAKQFSSDDLKQIAITMRYHIYHAYDRVHVILKDTRNGIKSKIGNKGNVISNTYVKKLVDATVATMIKDPDVSSMGDKLVG